MLRILLYKLEIIVLIFVSWMFFLFLMSYCEDLAKYILPKYSYFNFPVTFLFLMPSWILIMYLLLYAYHFVKYIIRFLFHNHVYVPLFVPSHKIKKSYKFYKKIGLEEQYWRHVTRKFKKD